MDEEKSAPSKRAIVDSLVLACRYSRLRDIVGTDALRSVLDVEYRELIADGTFNLQQVWELFEAQPGFDPNHAAAPLCRFKSWERQLGIEVTLPATLRNASDSERAELAKQCDVPAAELQKTLRGAVPEDGEPDKRDRKKAERPRRTSQEVEPGAARDTVSYQRLALTGVAALAGLVGFLVGGMFLYHDCSPTASYETVTIELPRSLPASKPERFGRQLRATLTDERWLTSPEEDRRAALTEAVQTAARQDIDVLYLQDRQGKVRAIAQLFDNGQQVRIVFK